MGSEMFGPNVEILSIILLVFKPRHTVILQTEVAKYRPAPSL